MPLISLKLDKNTIIIIKKNLYDKKLLSADLHNCHYCRWDASSEASETYQNTLIHRHYPVVLITGGVKLHCWDFFL